MRLVCGTQIRSDKKKHILLHENINNKTIKVIVLEWAHETECVYKSN